MKTCPMFQPLSSSRSYVCGRCVAAIRQSQLGVSRKISGSARARHGARQHDASSSALEVLEARGYIKEIAGYALSNCSEPQALTLKSATVMP